MLLLYLTDLLALALGLSHLRHKVKGYNALYLGFV